MQNMTCYNCTTKCTKQCGYICYGDHTNKDCHLKQCCKFKNSKRPTSKDMSSGHKICEVTCCLAKECKSRCKYFKCEDCDQMKRPGLYKSCNVKDINSSYKGNCHHYISSEFKDHNEQKIYEMCCCLVDNCKCKEDAQQIGSKIPRTLCEDLPLYDEKSHLLGYIKRGSIIDMPFCAKSQDPTLEEKSITIGVDRKLPKGSYQGCMASCRYAEGVRKQNANPAMSRWTTKAAFDHAIGRDKPAQQKTKPCPCEK